MQSQAKTVEEYLQELPEERRKILEAVMEVIRQNLDQTYKEGMQYGMVGYYVPHSVYPAGYHVDPRQPLPFLCLASQKNYLALYAMGLYADETARQEFERDWKSTGKKLDLGKSCLRFKKLDELALDVLAASIRRMTAEKYIAIYESSIKDSRKKTSKKKVSGTSKAKPDGASGRKPRKPK